jgi:hypothetical protein
MKSFQYLKLTVFIALVLENLFYSNLLACLCNSCLKNDTERTISNDFLSIISHTLYSIKGYYDYLRLLFPINNLLLNSFLLVNSSNCIERFALVSHDLPRLSLSKSFLNKSMKNEESMNIYSFLPYFETFF